MTAVLLLNSSRYSGLSIKYVRGADPVIKLLDDADEIIEVRVPIQSSLHRLRSIAVADLSIYNLQTPTYSSIIDNI